MLCKVADELRGEVGDVQKICRACVWRQNLAEVCVTPKSSEITSLVVPISDHVSIEGGCWGDRIVSTDLLDFLPYKQHFCQDETTKRPRCSTLTLCLASLLAHILFEKTTTVSEHLYNVYNGSSIFVILAKLLSRVGTCRLIVQKELQPSWQHPTLQNLCSSSIDGLLSPREGQTLAKYMPNLYR